MKNNKKSFVDSITPKAPLFHAKEKQDLDMPEVKKEKVTAKPATPVKAAPIKQKEKLKFLHFKLRKGKLSWHGSLIILLLLPVMLVAVASYLYQTNNEGKIYSGVYTFGVNVGGKTKEEAGKLIDNKISSYKLVIEGENQRIEADYDDLGIKYDKEKIIDEAYQYGRDQSVFTNFFNRAKRFLSRYELGLGTWKYSFEKHNVNLAYSIDEEKLNKYLTDIEGKINVAPKDSEVKTQGSSMQIIPAVFGRKLRTAELRDAILAASTKFENQPIKMAADVASPTILDDQTRVLAETADKVTSKKVSLTYQNKTYVPTKEVVVSWVTFTRPDDKSPWQMVIDPSKMTPYFKTIGKEINVYSTAKKIRIENGTKEIVTQEGANGLIIDEGTLGSQISKKLESEPMVTLTIPMKVDNFKTLKDYVVVANWDKYIDVNISSQRMEAYLKGGERVGSWAVTTGKNGWNTPTGTHLISRKAYNVCMPNPPYSQPLCGIHYVSYFTSAGHAIHQAWWRSSFGGMDYVWNGSHGCVNATLSVAQFIYDWAPIGTPVIIHY